MRKRAKHEVNFGNSPFTRLDGILKHAGIKLKPASQERPAPVEIPPAEETEEEIFVRAMAGVVRANWRHEPLPSTSPSPQPENDPEPEDLRLMQAAMQAEAVQSFDHPEYIEGWIGVDGKRFLPHLRSGLYSIQGQIDLHGLSRPEAQEMVEHFILSMARFRSCCVKIIHGRGMNSPTDKAILKDSLQGWLSTRRMSRHVVAYASAPVKDGGVGAIYVLLRRTIPKMKDR